MAVGQHREFGSGFLDDGGVQVGEQQAGGAVELFEDFTERGDDGGVPDAGGRRAVRLDALSWPDRPGRRRGRRWWNPAARARARSFHCSALPGPEPQEAQTMLTSAPRSALAVNSSGKRMS